MKLNLQITKVTIACFILLSAVNFTVKAQEVITLQKAIDRTLERNLTIKQAQFSEAISEENLKQSKYNQLPNLTAGPQASLNFGRNIDPSTNQFTNQHIFALNGTLSSQVTLFQGGQLRNQIIANKLLLGADRSYTAKIKNDLVLNVVTQYLLILTNQDLVTAAQQQIDIAKITLDRAQKNFDVGNQTQADLSQAKAAQSTADLNYTNAENQLELSVITLKQYMEMPPATNIIFEKPDISRFKELSTVYDPEVVLKTALAVNPDVTLAEARQKAAAQDIKVARGNYFPSVVLFGQVGTNYSDARRLQGTPFATGRVDTIGFVQNTPNAVTIPNFSVPILHYPIGRQLSDNFNQAIGVTLQIPIFNRFSSRTSVRKAKITNENAIVTAQLAKNNLSKIIYQAVWDVQAANKRYISTQQTYNANKDAFNIIQQRYNVGLVNSLDYNTSLTNLNKSQFDLINAQYEVVFRSKVIDYYLGNPITL
ncbi:MULTISPECIES: TolC family protein [unclassified Mucilaginibacter]|uniref:TolC family protein n=1 Tax=unclassified Mucilaginibacter TaxID=2617802 RepID=UPI002AC9AB0C|nr:MULTISPECIES: TolC family protein [unclassified Mucilaginibacter]MEB0261204.1 TolC family protein [Mucilaginibacter sp. 10I4]MEB0280377.1 TolC family protein [Mucilaginibacter sp. 10B2]MEB0300398.1 TolC family protein [Mucilaginibacter sp. 5C4]WPX24532.1 TolC family protein [Mucilaginibacter sp. 5C4]